MMITFYAGTTSRYCRHRHYTLFRIANMILRQQPTRSSRARRSWSSTQQLMFTSNTSSTNPLDGDSLLTTTTTTITKKKGLALVMGVANERSIAWACVESFLRKNYDCIVTYHIPNRSNNSTGTSNEANYSNDQYEKYKSKMNALVHPYLPPNHPTKEQDIHNNHLERSAHIIACLPCNVETDIATLCNEDLPKLLQQQQQQQEGTLLGGESSHIRTIDAVVHSLAYAPEMDRPLLQTSSAAYLMAQHISAYSFLETIRECLQNRLLSPSNAAVTTLSYLGAIRAVPGYGSMSPAKAALESMVRTLAYEMGTTNTTLNNTTAAAATTTTTTNVSNPIHNTVVRVNAVSAGPIQTVSARGISNFTSIRHHVEHHAPLQRNVTVQEVAETVTWLSTKATGITGQTIYVDAGYNSVVPIQIPEVSVR
jgi:enoyl-[acyl-carrier-protein] reductase (NADH)